MLDEWCSFCSKDVPENQYDLELDMCEKCKARLRVKFKKSDNKKPLGKLKSLKFED